MSKLDLVNPVLDIPIDPALAKVLGCVKRVSVRSSKGFDIQLAELLSEYDLPDMTSSIRGEYGAANIALVNGKIQGYFLALNYLVMDHKRIIFPEYAHEDILLRAKHIGLEMNTCPVGKDGFFVTKELKKVIQPSDIIFMYNPSQPFGMLASGKKMAELAKIFKANNCVVFTDDTMNRIIYEGIYNHIGKYYKNHITLFSLALAMSIQPYDLCYLFSPNSEAMDIVDVMVKLSMGEIDPPKLAAALVWLVDDKDEFQEVTRFLQEKRDHIAATFEKFGTRPVLPQAGHKMMTFIDKEGSKRLDDAGLILEQFSDREAVVADFNTSLGVLERMRLKADNG